MSNITAIYVRVSTTKESQKDSPEHQEMLCREKARTLDLDVQFTYEDRDTGTSIIKRPEIQRLIEDAKAGYFSTIIFASLSRFSRDTLDSLSLKRALVDHLGIRLVSIEEGFDSLKDNDELKFQIISAVNQKLSEQISLSSKRGLRQSALKGNFTGSVAPYGYRKIRVGDRKTIEPDENANTVKLIYDLYVNSKMGEKAIVNYLNEKGISSPKGGLWGITTVQRILTNEAYIGNNVFSKYELKQVYNDISNLSNRKKKQVQRDKAKWDRTQEKTHEPIIDDELFLQAQEIRLHRGGGKRGGVRNKVNIFAGMIFCKHCGSSVVSAKSKNGKNLTDGKEYRYLICSKRRRIGEKGCVNDLWLPYDDFRETVIKEISKQLREKIDVERITQEHKTAPIKVQQFDTDKEKKKLEKTLQVNRKLLFELRKEYKLGDIDEEQYKFEKEQLEKEISIAQQQLAKITDTFQVEKNLNMLEKEIKKSLDELVNLSYDRVDELQLVLRKLIKKIEVNKEAEAEIYTPLGIL
jgi:site-specific DNA recombinase